MEDKTSSSISQSGSWGGAYDGPASGKLTGAGTWGGWGAEGMAGDGKIARGTEGGGKLAEGGGNVTEILGGGW